MELDKEEIVRNVNVILENLENYKHPKEHEQIIGDSLELMLYMVCNHQRLFLMFVNHMNYLHSIAQKIHNETEH